MTFRTWWTAWRDSLMRFGTLAASLASILGLMWGFLPSPADLPGWAIGLLVLAGTFLILFVVLEVLHRGTLRVYDKSDADGIRKYMHDWIQHGGRVAIWTRDMSWAMNPETRGLLLGKAQRGELILCLPELNELATELSTAGGEVCTYGSGVIESPASRFTIAFFGRDGARVAVGHAERDTHLIDEFGAGDPAYYLAEDLITLARSRQRGATP